MKTSVIIVNYKTTHVLTECIQSINSFEQAEDLEIIIVDNSSSEESSRVIKELLSKFKNVRALYLSGLESFSYANNRGIETSSGKYILLMNPDIIFENPIIDKLISLLETNKNVGAIAPALVGTDGKMQKFYYQKYPTIKQFIFFHSLILRPFYRTPFFVNKYQINNEINLENKKLNYVEHIPGAFFFTTRDIINEVGLLDENFILFFEDADLSYRIHQKYRLVVDTQLEIKHLGGTSFKQIEWWVYGRFNSSMIYFFKKHYSMNRYKTLKRIAIYNANCMLLLEKIFKLFGKKDTFRIRKYRNFLELVKEV